jgi:diguanylate cyclase (GGDEF)-like protein
MDGRISTRSRIVAVVIAIEAVALAFLIWQGTQLESVRVESIFSANLARLRGALAAAVHGPLEAGDLVALQRILEHTRDDAKLDYIFVKDEEGRVVASAGGPQTAGRLDALLQDAFADRRFDTAFTVPVRNAPGATVRLGLGVEGEMNQIQAALAQSIALACGAFAVSILLWLAVIQPLARRVRRLQVAAEQVATGHYDVQFDERDTDEIAALGRSFKTMADLVRQRVAQLEEAHALQEDTARRMGDEQSRLASLLSAIAYGVTFVDLEGRIVYANPAFEGIWSIRDTGPLLGHSFFRTLASAEDPVIEQPEFPQRLAEMLAVAGANPTLEVRLLSGRALKLQVCPVLDESGTLQGSVIIHEDVTPALESQKKLLFLADRDPLTGLYNRRRFENDLGERVAGARRSGKRVALLLFDLDEFKSINDLFGHRMGDQVLVQVGNELRAHLRQGEFLARLGGDEFALVADDVDAKQIALLAERVMRLVSGLSLSVGEVRVSLTSSVGIALSPDHTTDPQDLVSHADVAMYQAKEAGKNTWRIYEAGHAGTLRQRSLLKWNDRIRQALRRDGFVIHLQGVFGAKSRERHYSEALVRMIDETTGAIIPPGEFIGYAEKSNLIVDLDIWMIEAIVRLLAGDLTREPIAVNVSGRSLGDPRVAELIAQRLAERKVAPSRLLLEITETAAVGDVRDAQDFIQRVHAVGCKVSLDDFGAGFANFSYIKHMPVDVVKIDGIFVRGLAQSHENRLFVKAIVDIAHGFGKITVAESVEDDDALAILASYGVDMVQGFGLERPQAIREPGPDRLPQGHLA